MQNHELMLPGGLSHDGQIERQARFHILTGRLEQQLSRAANDSNRVTFVSAVLAAALESIGDEALTPSLVGQLCVADRQFLMMRLATILAGETLWLKATCGSCESPFDIEINRSELPVKNAGPGYPFADIELENHRIVARVPNGSDQQLAIDCHDEKALQKILDRCVVSVDGRPAEENFVQTLSAADMDIIDQALDDVSPAVCNQLQLSCPECDQHQVADIDHYHTDGLNESTLFDEVHTLASHYHWSEADILDLPRDKRHRYVDMISRSQGHG